MPVSCGNNTQMIVRCVEYPIIRVYSRMPLQTHELCIWMLPIYSRRADIAKVKAMDNMANIESSELSLHDHPDIVRFIGVTADMKVTGNFLHSEASHDPTSIFVL